MTRRPRLPARAALGLLADTARGFDEHGATRMGAALAFYAASSLGPLLLIAIAITGTVFGREAAEDRIFAELRGLLGASAAEFVQSAVAGAARPTSSRAATIVGAVLLFVTASAVFAELHGALNTIWGVRPRPNHGLRSFVRERLLSFTLVLGVGFISLVSLLSTAVLAALGHWMSGALPGGTALWEILTSLFVFTMTGGLFGLIFRFVPDVALRWHEVLVAGMATSLLFSAGRAALGLYLRVADVGSAYGATASLIVLLVWVYFNAQLLYLGAEFARALTAANGIEVHAIRGALLVPRDRPQG